jgi:hypothetical protein
MVTMSYREISRMVEEEGTTRTAERLTSLLEQKKLSWRDFSIRHLAEGFCGREWVENMEPKRGSPSAVARLLEADGVRYSDFSHITGQIFFDAVDEAFEAPEYVLKAMIPSRESKIMEIERVPNISAVGDESMKTPENKEFKAVGVTEDYRERAAMDVRGLRVEVSKKAILGDLTGMLVEQCQSIGESLAISIEKRLADAIIDANAGATSINAGGHRYHWKGTSYATYQASAPWVNISSSNPLANWTSLDAAWQVLRAIVDPYTGEPIIVRPDCLIVTDELAWLANYVLRATEARRGDITTGTGTQEIGASPTSYMLNNVKPVASQYLTARVAAASQDASDWYLADKRAWERVYRWDVETQERGTDSEAAFLRDVIYQFRATMMDVVATKQPRFAVRGDAA